MIYWSKINIKQKSLGQTPEAFLEVPSRKELKTILKKYDYQLPHLEDQVINRYIKEVAQEAGITELVEIETTKGGTPKKEKAEKLTDKYEYFR